LRKVGPRGKKKIFAKAIGIHKKKTGVATQFFEILKKNADISIFHKKEGNDISSQSSMEFAFKYR